MIADQHTSTRQATAAVAAFFGLLLVVIFLVTRFLLANGNLQAEFDTKSRILSSLEQRDSLSRLTNANLDGPTMQEAAISAVSETIAASELHKILLDSLEEAGGSVHSIQAEATTDTTGDGLRRLTAQATFDSSMDSLQRILFKLETARPYVFIDSLVVQPSSSSTAGTQPWEVLRATLVTSSYWRSLGGGTDSTDSQKGAH